MKYAKQLGQVQNILNQHGLGHITVKVENHLNDRDKKVPHLVAYNPNDLIVEVETGKLVFTEGLSCKFEELNKYFSAELFAMGITQRADYLKAPHEIKVRCYNDGIHPAQYRVGMVTIVEPVKKSKRDYTAKVEKYQTLLNGAELMADTKKIEYYTRKLKYFTGRQLLTTTDNC